MERRDFLRTAALAGLALLAPAGSRRARAEGEPYTGPLFVTVHAAGGWDPIYLCDPKLDARYNRRYTEAGEASGIRFAKIAYDPVFLQLEQQYREAYAAYLPTPEAFFTKHAGKFLCVNGIDTTTNGHDTGTRVTWSGRTSEGYPAFAALAAGVMGPGRPMAFLSAGGFDATQDVVPLTRIGRMDIFQRIAFPNRLDAGEADSPPFHMESTYARILRTQKERMLALQQNERLPRVKRAVGALYAARTSDVGLDRLALPERLVEVPGYQLDDLQGLMQQAQIALSAFKAGLAVSANLSLGGFDTHGGHDRAHTRQLLKLLGGVDYLLEEAARAGVANRLTVIVGSDFGRGPHFNGQGDGGGKDHWPITSMLLTGPGIRGGRTIGATDGDVKPVKLDPATLEPNENGIRLRPEHIHKDLRRLIGIETAPAAARFPLAGEDVRLLA
jgi:hypothetical protein